jgi:hypothetical protein
MPEKNQDFDRSFYVLCVVGYWILALDALATPEGREQVKAAFRDAMLSAGSFEALSEIPEFVAAMRDIDLAARTGIIVADPAELTPADGKAV